MNIIMQSAQGAQLSGRAVSVYVVFKQGISFLSVISLAVKQRKIPRWWFRPFKLISLQTSFHPYRQRNEALPPIERAVRPSAFFCPTAQDMATMQFSRGPLEVFCPPRQATFTHIALSLEAVL
jgi:hypothetical protein